jgi:hypothetical protein
MKQFRNRMRMHYSYLNECHHTDLLNEIDYEVLMSKKQMQIAKEFFRELTKTEVQSEGIKVTEIVRGVHKLRQLNGFSAFQFPEDFINTLNIDVSKSAEQIQTLFNVLVDIRMPSYMMKSFIERIFITEDMGIAVLIEYIKFLILKSTNHDIVPSFLVDLFWREHFTNTAHYRELNESVFGKDNFILYEQSSGGSFKQRYEITLITYEDTFKIEAIPFIWKSYDEEIELKKLKFYEANIFRLALYECYEEEIGNFY